MTQFTSKAIEESFIRLLNERPLDKITIKDIVDDCGISRNTFYYHFQDKYDLVNWIFRTESAAFLAKAPTRDNWQDILRGLCRYFEENRAFYRNALDGFISAARFALENKRLVYHIYNSVSRERVERYLYSIAGEVMRLYVSRITEQVEHAAHKKVFPEDQKMVVDFYKFALVGMILDWLNTGMKKDPEGLIRRVGEIFHGNIEAALTRVAR